MELIESLETEPRGSIRGRWGIGDRMEMGSLMCDSYGGD